MKGSNDKKEFPMKNGVFSNHRVRALLMPENRCFRPRRDEERNVFFLNEISLGKFSNIKRIFQFLDMEFLITKAMFK